MQCVIYTLQQYNRISDSCELSKLEQGCSWTGTIKRTQAPLTGVKIKLLDEGEQDLTDERNISPIFCSVLQASVREVRAE